MAYPLMGTRIVLDEEKILREKKYDLEKMYRAIDEYAQERDMVKIDKYTYHCKRDENDLKRLGGLVYWDLIELEWFTQNVKEWLWLDDEEGDVDIISYNKAKNQGVWE